MALTNYGPADIAVTLGDVSGKAIGPAAYPCRLWDHLQLILMVGNNLSQLILDIVGLNRLSADSGQGLGGSLELALLDKVSR